MLGKGSTAVTYVATDTHTGERVAAKVVDMRQIEERCVDNEITVLQMLDHRNIVGCQGHGRSRR